MVVDLGYRPRKWQQECHQKRKRFTVLALHRRAGKTELAVRQLIHEALKCSLELAHFVYLAPFLKQAKAIAWERICAIVRLIPGHEINQSELWVRLPNGAKIQIYGGDNPDGMRGLRLDGVVIDEVAQIKPEVWNEIVQPALSDRKGWALFIGTPKGVNLFSELYYRALTLPDWHGALYTVNDTEALDPDEVARLRRDMPDNEFAREYLCDFTAAAENQLISIGLAEEAAHRPHLREDSYSFAAKILGVDVARFGDDKSVIFPRQGLVTWEPKVFQGLDNMEFAAQVATSIDKWNPDAVFVDIGNGSGVVDRLRQLGYAVIEVNFGSKALDPIYVNRRTEMHWKMREWLDAGGRIPNRTSLKQDLAAPTYNYNAKNQRVLETKDQIKARIMRSPDESDALALTFAHPVAPSLKSIHPAFGKPRIQTEYDPFDGRER